ncbi:flagellar filament capping protein FliD [Variovorax sp. KK3]|uniref:flagellar filament capping protein FliD n=1 Tax=Variovorax sp. KK3 TaxID=1855728 RepID=UPI00097C96BB|nr:flagellar filament capping protein FliD [Variovorax sp. KK3]
MASISSLGIGSNLDLSTLLTNLQTAESQPLLQLQQRQVSYTSKLSAYGQLQSALTTLQASAKKLGDPVFFQGVKAAAGTAEVLSASAGGTAAPGTYNINVTQMAQAQSLVATGQASAKTAIGSGTITIDFGTIGGGTYDAVTGKYSGASFTPDAERTAKSITIDPAKSTLEDIRDAVNAAKAGVTASIVNDGSGTPNRLVLSSTETGKASSMRIAVAGDAALANLVSHDPAGSQSLQQTIQAQNAELTVNGIAVTSKSNTVKESIQGVTLNLLKVGTSSLGVTRDTATIETAINDFVKAYNALQTTAGSLTAYDAGTKSGAALMGDSTLRNIQVAIRQVLTNPQSGVMKTMSEIGVGFTKDGTLALDSDKLRKAMADNLEGVAGLFSSATGSTEGYGKQLSALVDKLTSTGGALQAATEGMKASIKDLDDQYDDMQERVDAKMAIYRAQFTQLDLLVSRMNSTSTYLTQQFASMSNSSK